ncbi:MAG: hypothetical protein K0R71_1453 [Bacillales bacterium]|jgi:uncharacterized protein YdiU (UPF0061 family)|nr:hypothetical protein [Bacillales bacterium]
MIEKMERKDFGWKFDNSYARLPQLFYSKLNPTPVHSPKMIMFNVPLANYLGLNDKLMQSEKGVEMLSGNEVPEGAFPLAQAYAGHQFGHFTMLGDGRAMLLGEQITPQGNRFDIQYKGSGKTPYSRRGDGLAALGPMLREYIISEAMHALGIPTTRSLAVVSTGESIVRYKMEPGAILTRVASSHIRVGTFQFVSEWGKLEELRKLADYTIERHFPEANSSENCYIHLLQEVMKRQAFLVTKWQLVGFIHGVMNTDNMAICGETIDYGPCAFMDTYDPATVFSSIDNFGRYAYDNQPKIAAWNLARFAETLLPLLDDNKEQAVKIAQDVISEFHIIYHQSYMNGMRAKLGIFNEESEDEGLINNLLSLMHKYQADYTNTFRALSNENLDGMQLFESPEFSEWYKLWKERLSRQSETKESSLQLMRNSNPAVIPRNHRVEEALEAAVEKGDYSVMARLLEVLSTPYSHVSDKEDFTKVPETSSCSYKTFCGT